VAQVVLVESVVVLELVVREELEETVVPELQDQDQLAHQAESVELEGVVPVEEQVALAELVEQQRVQITMVGKEVMLVLVENLQTLLNLEVLVAPGVLEEQRQELEVSGYVETVGMEELAVPVAPVVPVALRVLVVELVLLEQHLQLIMELARHVPDVLKLFTND